MAHNSTPKVEIRLRIPGKWSGPKELVERMPPGFKLTAEALILPDSTPIEFEPRQADGQFAQIFRSSCRQPATREELAVVDSYSVNFCLMGPGGSLESARWMMLAGAAIVRAGGAGVFIDNCALAHGGQNWIEMAEDGGPDALSFAFVSIVRGPHDVHTMGMHVLGLRDIVMKREDAETDDFGIIDVIRYMSASTKPIEDGHVLANLNGPRFRASACESDKAVANSPMHNPFGRLKLVSMRDVADSN